MKYTTAKTAGGGYDFYIAKYGYHWTLDVLSLQEAGDLRRLSDRLGEIGVDMLPDEAKRDVVEFVRINSKYSLTLEEKEQQEAYFRTQSEKNLAGLCPKLGSSKLSGKSEE